MHSLEKRVATLEATVKLSDDITIVKRFVSVGAVDCELQSLHDDDGRQWRDRLAKLRKS